MPNDSKHSGPSVPEWWATGPNTRPTTWERTTFCIVFRTGGTENFVWHRSFAMSRAEAEEALARVLRGGRKAYLVNYAQSLAIGLPETFEGTDE